MELAPQQLIDWAVRLPAYQGVVAARVPVQEGQQTGSSDGVRHVDPTLAGLAADPIFNTIIDFE